MKNKNVYKEMLTLEKRKEESDKILKRYESKIPIICLLDKKLVRDKSYFKYLADSSVSLSNIMFSFRRKVKLTPEQALFCLSQNSTVLSASSSIGEIYNIHKDMEDKFLYIYFVSENVFGI